MSNSQHRDPGPSATSAGGAAAALSGVPSMSTSAVAAPAPASSSAAHAGAAAGPAASSGSQGPALGFNAVSGIENDLRTLCVETRKKFPELQQSAERAILKIRNQSRAIRHAVESGLPEANQLIIDALRSDQVLRPFLRACATKNAKLLVLALGSIQRLLVYNAVDPAYIPTVIGQLRMHSGHDDMQVQLKILQTLLLAVSASPIADTPMPPTDPQSHSLPHSQPQQPDVLAHAQANAQSADSDSAAAAAAAAVAAADAMGMPASHPSKVVANSQDSLLQALGICLRMHDSKDPIIQNTSFATMRQVIELQFERVSEMMTAGPHPQFQRRTSSDTSMQDPSLTSPALLPPEARNAHLLFHDLCSVAVGDGNMRWLNLNHPLPQSVGVELIESILHNSAPLFLHVPAFSALVRDLVCPFVVRLLRSSSSQDEQFPLTLRLVRTLVVIVRQYHTLLRSECEMFLSMIVRMLEAEQPWHRHLALEAVRNFCHDPYLLYFFFDAFDLRPPATKIFGSTAHALGRFVHQSSLDHGGAGTSSSSGAQTLMWEVHVAKGKGLEFLNEQEPPQFDDMHAVSIAVEALINIVNGLASLQAALSASSVQSVRPMGHPMETNEDRLVFHNDDDGSDLVVDTDVLSQMMNVAWCPILTALSFLLSKSQEETLIQHLLIAFQTFANSAGLLHLDKARDAFLAQLCRFALPDEMHDRDDVAALRAALRRGAISLSSKNIQSFKALFNIAHCLGGILESAWFQILETFEKLDTIIQMSKVHATVDLAPPQTSGAGSVGGGAVGAGGSGDGGAGGVGAGGVGGGADGGGAAPELQILEAALSRLFESTRYLDDGAIAHVLSALGTLSLSSLANAATDETEATLLSDSHLDHQMAPHPVALGSARSSSGVLHRPTSPTGASPSMAGGMGGASSSSGIWQATARPPHMFALVSLINTIQHNMFRIGSANIWEIAVGHLNCVINHKDPTYRRYGVQALCRLTIQALGIREPGPEPKLVGLEKSAFELARELEEARHAREQYRNQHNFQQLLLEPLSEIWKSKYEDTRRLMLDAIFEILQATGQNLREGWPSILRILDTVVRGPSSLAIGAPVSLPSSEQTTLSTASSGAATETGDGSSADSMSSAPVAPPNAQYVPIGFRSLELVVNDFFDCINYEDVGQLIATIGLYCAQRLDPNISFTSIGLLWRVSDYIQRVAGVKVSRRVSFSQDAPPSGGGGGGSASDALAASASLAPGGCGTAAALSESGYEHILLSEEAADALMLAVYKQLQQLSVDLRSEVRNSAIKTLDETIIAHAERMRPEMWQQCLTDVLFPLLSELLTSERDRRSHGASGTQLGKEKATGKAVMMLVHYSRDTAEKQWNETRVFALRGAARVLRTYLQHACRAAHAAGGTGSITETMVRNWRQFLDLVDSTISHSSCEVALAGIHTLQDVLESVHMHTATNLAPEMWSLALELYVSITTVAVEKARVILEPAEAAIRDMDAERDVGSMPATASPFALAMAPVQGHDATIAWERWVETYTRLVTSLHGLLTNARNQFSEQDTALFLHLVHELICANTHYEAILLEYTQRMAGRQGGRAVSQLSKQTSMQKAALKLLANVAPLPASLWPAVINVIVVYIRGGIDATTDEDDRSATLFSGDDGAFASALPEFPRLALSASYPKAFSQAAIAVLVKLYRSSLPEHVSARHFGTVMLCLNDVINLPGLPTLLQPHRGRKGGSLNAKAPGDSKRKPLDVSASVASIRSFLEVASRGLPAINTVGCEDGDHGAERIWRLLATSIARFLGPLPKLVRDKRSASVGEPSAEDVAQWEEMQLFVVESLVKHLLAFAKQCPGDCLGELVDLLNAGLTFPFSHTVPASLEAGGADPLASTATTATPPSTPTSQSYAYIHNGRVYRPTHEHLNMTQACLSGMLVLCARGSEEETEHTQHRAVAQLALKLLMSRSQLILRAYIDAEAQSGQFPVPQFRRQEATFLLSELARLRLHPLVSDVLEMGNLHESLRRSPSAHVLRLFPTLCDCISIQEPELKVKLQQLFRVASNALGLVDSSKVY